MEGDMEAVLTPTNMRAAIARVKAHTTPGRDGVPIETYAHLAKHDDILVNHLLELYTNIQQRGEMTQNMKESVTSMVFKGGDKKPDNPANYRPIAVTAIEYRILATAMAQRLAEIMHRLIGG